jgi:hypothetical protein
LRTRPSAGQRPRDATRLTDRRGRFLYENVPAGAYVLTVKKSGYYDGAYGKRRPAGSALPFEIAATQSVGPTCGSSCSVAACITGSVVDEGSEPVAGRAASSRFAATSWKVNGATPHPAAASPTTSARFACSVLEPGEYIVSTPTTQANTSEGEVLTATLADIDERATAYPSMFYPAARYFPLAHAVAAHVRRGEVRRGLQVVAGGGSNSERPAHRQRVGDRQPGSSPCARLTARAPAFGTEAAITLSGPDGAFTFVRVPAGDYRLEAGAAFTGQIEETAAVTWGRADVAVDRRGRHETGSRDGWRTIDRGCGHVGCIGVRPDAGLVRVPVTLVPAAPGLSPVSKIAIDADGTFTRTNLVPGPYYIRVGATPPGRLHPIDFRRRTRRAGCAR